MKKNSLIYLSVHSLYEFFNVAGDELIKNLMLKEDIIKVYVGYNLIAISPNITKFSPSCPFFIKCIPFIYLSIAKGVVLSLLSREWLNRKSKISANYHQLLIEVIFLEFLLFHFPNQYSMTTFTCCVREAIGTCLTLSSALDLMHKIIREFSATRQSIIYQGYLSMILWLTWKIHWILRAYCICNVRILQGVS